MPPRVSQENKTALPKAEENGSVKAEPEAGSETAAQSDAKTQSDAKAQTRKCFFIYFPPFLNLTVLHPAYLFER